LAALIFIKISGSTLAAALVGLVIGLVIAALFSIPIALLPKPFSSILPFVAVLIFGYLGVAIAISRQADIHEMFNFTKKGQRSSSQQSATAKWQSDKSILIDTSVIIDGRIADIAHTGFVPGNLVIPASC
jgi:uncharacterized protein YacL